MNDASDDIFDRALTLKSIVESLATGVSFNEALYQKVRSELMANRDLRDLLPSFVRNNIDEKGLWGHMKSVHSGSGAYAVRRAHIVDAFEPLLKFLSQKSVPADTGISETLTRYNGEGVRDAWQKALRRREADPEGAITAARTLLEEVCKHILEDCEQKYEEKWDLPKLYSSVVQNINLAPSQYTEEAFKKILGSCQAIVETIGELRNKISDAHGGGRKRVRPTERHAALAVNLAGTMATFLIQTYEDRQSKAALIKAKSERLSPNIVHNGVILISRYNLESEIREMARIVDALGFNMCSCIESIFCDSKAGAVYSLHIRKGMWKSGLVKATDDAVYSSCGGYNGIFFEGDAPKEIDIGARWPE